MVLAQLETSVLMVSAEALLLVDVLDACKDRPSAYKFVAISTLDLDLIPIPTSISPSYIQDITFHKHGTDCYLVLDALHYAWSMHRCNRREQGRI